MQIRLFSASVIGVDAQIGQNAPNNQEVVTCQALWTG